MTRPILAPAIVLVVFAILPGNARAQLERAAPRPSRGMFLPGQTLTLDPDATAVEGNPAQSAFLRGWNVVLAHTELAPGARYLGRGSGIFWAFKVPFLPLHAMLSGQVVRPSDDFGAGYPTMGKISFGLSWRAASWIGLGFAAHAFIAPGKGFLHGKGSLDLGLTLRPARWLAFALAVRDVTNPSWGGLPLQRVWELEVGIRPVFSERLAFAVGIRVGERRQNLQPHFQLQFAPWPGLTLFTDATWLRRDLDSTDGMRRVVDDARVTAGLRLDFEHIGFTAGFVGGLHTRRGGAAAGGSIAVRISGSRYPTVAASNARVLLVDVKGTGDAAEVWRLLAVLHRAARDPGVRGVLLKIGDVGGWAVAEELRRAVADLRRRKRKVLAYLFAGGPAAYYVACAADRIVLFPGGGLRVAGLSATGLYLKGTLDKLGVKAQFIKHAEYKTAPEALTRRGPSPEALKVRRSILDEFSGRFYGAMASRPKIRTAARAKALLARGPFTAGEARYYGLVDSLAFPDKLDKAFLRLFGRGVPVVRPPRRPARRDAWGLTPTVVILNIQGDIVRGKSQTIPLLDMKMVGAQTLVPILKALRSAPHVKAVVLRVESGGGDALASEHIWRHVALLGKVKPVVASFGNVAASGGYFLAAGVKRIYASPSTITGSIGIFSGKVDLSGLLAKIGVTTHTEKRGKRADVESLYRPYTAAEMRALTRKLRYFYLRFVTAVAKGRKKLGTVAKAEPLARGRVWTGDQARKRHLVDKAGSLWDAVQAARKLAGLSYGDGHRVYVYPRKSQSLLSTLVRLFVKRARTVSSNPLLRRLLKPLSTLPPSVLFAPPRAPLARLPFRIRIK